MWNWMKNLGLASVLLLSTSTMGEVIRLKPAIAVNVRQDVRLGDVAAITGGTPEHNEELANMVIISGVQKPQKVKAESILMVILAQRGGAAIGGLQISGAAECEITLAGNVPVSAAAAAPRSAPVPPASPESTDKVANPAPAAVINASAAAADPRFTLRGTLLATLKKAIDLPEGEYEITIESNLAQLDRPVEGARQWHCRLMTRTLLGTVQVESQLVDGTRVVEKLNVMTTIRRRQQVVILTRKIGQGDVITADALRSGTAMLDRKIATLFGSISEVVGMEAQRDISLGERADQRDFKPLMLARKGQPVTVVYVSGSLQLQITGRAMDDAKRNERIQIRNDRTGEVYSAVMIGKGVGVAGGTLTETQEKKLLEALQ
jgi:flagella basal body P-ring formation protein FlgA